MFAAWALENLADYVALEKTFNLNGVILLFALHQWNHPKGFWENVQHTSAYACVLENFITSTSWCFMKNNSIQV